jgi:hypothetical protein
VAARDTFSRTVTAAWGRPEVGGTWAVATNYPDYNVAGGRGTMKLSQVGDSRGAALQSVSIRDVDIQFAFGFDAAATGEGNYAYGVVRRVAGNSAYRFKVRVTPDGTVYLQATRLVRGVESDITVGEKRVQGLTYSPGTDLILRAQAVGEGTTTLRMKVWASGASEPAGWPYETTDTTPALQTAGAVGIRGYLSANATATVLLHVDDFRVAAP